MVYPLQVYIKPSESIVIPTKQYGKTFAVFDFYVDSTPMIIGIILAVLFGIIVMNTLYSKNLSINSIHNEKNVITLKRALAYIRNSYDVQITLQNIADSAGISPKYLCTFFKEMTGKSPFEYLNVYRIERASRKLINTDLSVTQIAYTCGFNDLSYFIKTFKQIKGVTPKNFRKNRT